MKSKIHFIILLLFLYSCKYGNNHKILDDNKIKQDSISEEIDERINEYLKNLFRKVPIYSNEDSIKYFYKPKLDLIDSLLIEICIIRKLPKNMHENYLKIVAEKIKAKKEQINQLREDYFNPNSYLSDLISDFDNDTLFIKAVENQNGRFANTIKGYNNTRTLIGDFNGDGVKDTVTVDFSEIKNEYSKFNYKLIFSDKKIPKFKIDTITNLVLVNEGDLNNDGKDEIGFLPGWNYSGCRWFYVITLKNNHWVYILEIPNTIGMRNKGIKLVEKDTSRKGYVFIRYSHPHSGCGWPPDAIEESVKLFK